VLRSPPPLQNLILSRHGWWNLWLLAGPAACGVPSELNALISAPAVRCPAVILLIHTDSVVPVQYQRRVVSAYAGPAKVVNMSTGDHNDPMDEATAATFAAGLNWLWNQRNEPSRTP
jgi:hypothetical protein